MRKKRRSFLLLLLLLLFFTGCRPAGTVSDTSGISLETGSFPAAEAFGGTEEALTTPAASSAPEPILETEGPSFILSFINVGKGDAFLLTLPDGSHYMIDTGKKSDFGVVEQLLAEKNVASLQGVFLSHGHKDHSGGLTQILKSGIPVETIYWLKEDDVSYKSIDVEETAEKYGCDLHPLHMGDTLILSDERHAVTVDVLGPETIDEKKGNNNSLILHIRYGGTSFMMTGDAELPELTALLQSGQDLKADVLKVGHHGKKDAYSPAFLDAVSPAYAILTGNREDDPKSNNSKVRRYIQALGSREFLAEGDFLAVDFISDGGRIVTALIENSHVSPSP